MTTEEKERQGTSREVRELVPATEYPVKLVARMLGIEYKRCMNYTSRNKIASFKKGGRRYVSVEEFNRVKSAIADGSFLRKTGRKKKADEKLGGSEVENPKQPTKIVDDNRQKKSIESSGELISSGECLLKSRPQTIIKIKRLIINISEKEVR